MAAKTDSRFEEAPRPSNLSKFVDGQQEIPGALGIALYKSFRNPLYRRNTRGTLPGLCRAYARVVGKKRIEAKIIRLDVRTDPFLDRLPLIRTRTGTVFLHEFLNRSKGRPPLTLKRFVINGASQDTEPTLDIPFSENSFQGVTRYRIHTRARGSECSYFRQLAVAKRVRQVSRPIDGQLRPLTINASNQAVGLRKRNRSELISPIRRSK